jgi:hypothetical protein
VNDEGASEKAEDPLLGWDARKDNPPTLGDALSGTISSKTSLNELELETHAPAEQDAPDPHSAFMLQVFIVVGAAAESNWLTVHEGTAAATRSVLSWRSFTALLQSFLRRPSNSS